METLGGKREMAFRSRSSSQAIGTPALRNFTIPRRKRGDGKALLDPCLKESRDYSLIQSTLNESRLDMGKEISLSWQWDDVTLIHNEELLRQFSEKRSEMRLKDRHVREMEERFCFLVTSDQKAKHIYQHGLKVENTDQHTLGNASYGVYLHRHADVALKNISGNTPAGKILIIFKVLFGKVKKVTPCYGRNSTHDPTVNYDCHVSKDPAVPRDTLSQQVLSSSVS
ncbi:protein TASOR isoform X2 [Coregonus clupeaformis]|uniref:protein TASOR isoform X2 n=1 Tax=Coregonus clupeaformis TaxID=59861 RepID=UPI001BE0E5A9|nr:protein TASOR isoform X2 [Coregonus clupeaformis]